MVTESFWFHSFVYALGVCPGRMALLEKVSSVKALSDPKALTCWTKMSVISMGNSSMLRTAARLAPVSCWLFAHWSFHNLIVSVGVYCLFWSILNLATQVTAQCALLMAPLDDSAAFVNATHATSVSKLPLLHATKHMLRHRSGRNAAKSIPLDKKTWAKNRIVPLRKAPFT